MSLKSFSIITVNYNNSLGLQKTIDSVINQTYKNFEFIVIDGNSTDGSKAVIIKDENKLDYWVSEPDNGIYNAMNKGIDMAAGKYLLFLNSGDALYDKDVLERVNTLINYDHDIYYGDIIYDEVNTQTKRVFPEKLSFSFFLEHNLSHQASFIKRKLFDDFFYYNEVFKIVSDWEFFAYAICKQNASYKHLDLIITNYDATGLSSNLSNHLVMHKERAQSINKYFPSFVDDYQSINELRSKRVQQFLHIKRNKLAWKVLKVLINLILFFLPKIRK